MKRRRLLLATAALLLITVPSPAVFNEHDLGQTIRSLKNELKLDHERRVASEKSFEEVYRGQRRDMIDIMKKCNELSLMLYSQKQDFTFDITYAFRSVSDEYEAFREKQLPYDLITDRLAWDIDRYARLLESLRRLPPRLEKIEAIPDSLAYHNDSLNFTPRFQRPVTPGLAASMGLQQASDTTRRRPYILSDEEQLDRDTCIFYASEMLKMCVARKDRIISDSTYYHRTHLRLKESYDYAQAGYKVLQDRIFVQGQTQYTRIIANFDRQWKRAVRDCREKYTFGGPFRMRREDRTPGQNLLWLIIAIFAALLVRLRKHELGHGLLLYLPLIVSAIAVFTMRIAFLPNSMMNILLPPVLLISLIWQVIACLRHGSKVPGANQFFGWTTVIVTLFALIVAVIGYIFTGLLIMVWWYFQMATVLSIMTILYLLELFYDKFLKKRIDEYRKSLTYLPTAERGTMLFGTTWFYDLVREVIVPVLSLMSMSICLKLSLSIFDFSDLYNSIIYRPFVDLTNADGVSVLRISVYEIFIAIALFFIFTYINKALFYAYRRIRYAAYLKKTGLKTVRINEINLVLGRSVISIVVWFIYIIIIVVMLKLPTSSLTIIAGGLSAGIGIAMKDVINNFVYGIQLMSGRVRIGDWIECDGVRGKVTAISYQSTQIETLEGAVMSFLNSSLFAHNFRNLTRNNAYEFLKIVVGVSYGTDVAKVRTTLEEAMQELRTKDSYGREIVDPKKGIYVTFDAFDESSVNIAVKQYVLVSERIGYSDRARELIYNALDKAGITIPFPQRDIHVIDK